MKKQKNGKYRKQIYLGLYDTGKFDVNGEPILTRKYTSVYGVTIKEVEMKANDIKRKLDKEIDICAASDTFDKWAQTYLANKRTLDVSASYLSTLELFNRHLSSIKDIPLNKLRLSHFEHINRALLGKDESGNTILGAKPLSKRTISGVLQFAKNVFKLAMDHRVIDYNPIQSIVPSKEATTETRTAIPKDQQKWILETEHRAKRAAMIMLFAGLRRGEVGALTWDDINLEEGFSSVTKSVEFIHEQPSLKTPKTKSGIRTVDIPQVLIDYLMEERSKDGCKYVIHTKDGRMLSRTRWRFIWDSYMKDLNVKYGYTRNNRILLGIDSEKTIRKNIPGGLPMRIEIFTPHQLRHTFATNCYFADVPVEVCKDWMGHSKSSTTMDIYTHLDKLYKRSKRTNLNAYFQQLTG